MFAEQQFEGVFFADVRQQLVGSLPSGVTRAPRNSYTTHTSDASRPTSPAESEDDLSWHRLISATAVEDLIKGSKSRLDSMITTAPAFAAGGHTAARKEFSLISVMFALVETYPSEIRWKHSASAARQMFSRVAANAKIGSAQVFQESRQRLLDLTDLLSGTPLARASDVELDWSQLTDRSPLMQLLEWAQQEHVSTFAASKVTFEENRDQLGRFAELISVLGKVALAEEMPDASDEDYAAFAVAMIDAARQVRQAVVDNDAELARRAAAALGQSCANCHDNYR